uniref:uncharacterized protein LOC122606051 isoform X2 n=1 Tax=Erigeron canadensis TaxID=72917 RepID=UPI001CB8CDEF|nr:uncharacterized protein LOC122606051 isoform X2 [Erigeron canadensis]
MVSFVRRSRSTRGTALNISSCKKLESLSYNGRFEASTDFLSNFPCLQYLALSTIHPNLKLSSHSLKILALNPCCDLDVTDIDAPNLIFLKFSLYKSSNPLVRNPAKSEPQMEWFPFDDVNALSFKKLRRFLNKSTGFFKVLKLNICSSFIDVEELKVIDSPPIELKHVEVELTVREEPGTIDKLSAYVSAVDTVFWCLRPESLTLISDFESLDVEQRSRIVKTDIEIELSTSSSKDKKHFNDLKSLLAALPCEPLSDIITFIKVEDSNAVKEG